MRGHPVCGKRRLPGANGKELDRGRVDEDLAGATRHWDFEDDNELRRRLPGCRRGWLMTRFVPVAAALFSAFTFALTAFAFRRRVRMGETVGWCARTPEGRRGGGWNGGYSVRAA